MSSSANQFPFAEPVSLKKVKGKVVRQRLGYEDILRRGLFVLIALSLFVFMLYPLYKSLLRSFQNKAGEFVGLENYIRPLA